MFSLATPGRLSAAGLRVSLRFLLRAALVALLCVPASAWAQLADGQPKFLGAVGRGTTTPLPDADFGTYWNQVTPENAGKWATTENPRDAMRWAGLDYWYAYAQDRGLPFKQHTFVWGMQQPSWINALPPAEQRAEVEEWIRLYFQRYPETDFVDVLNEPITIPAGYRNALGGAGATGWDWVIWTFEKARQYRDQYAPDTQLLLNEHSILKNAGKMNRYLEIVDLLIARGLIDGIGLQGHFLEGTPVSTVQAHLDEVASRGLPIYISEFDLTFSSDQAQLAKYQELFPVLWEHPAVAGVTLWGYKQGEIWRTNAYLVRADGSERPALTWLRDYLAASTTAQAPYGGTPAPLPGRLEAEAFDEGGPGVAYQDADAQNQGASSLRAGEGVDVFTATSASGGNGVGWIADGEWLEFTVDVARAGDYALSARVATPQSGRDFRVEAGGASVAVPVPVTGGWTAWQTVEAGTIALAAGRQVVRLALADGPFNLDWVAFEATGTSVVVRARGTTGTERMELRVGGVAVQAWTVGTAFANYAATTPGAIGVADVSVAFTNDDGIGDGTGRDLRVDRVTVGGQVAESEAPSTYSTGTWTSGSGCAAGFKAQEWLHCGGAFFYGGAPAAAGEASADGVPGRAPLGVYPNPADGAATVAFALADADEVRVGVYDVLGRRVAALANGSFSAGRHAMPLDTAALPPGVYVVRIETTRGARVHRLTVAR